MVSEFEDEAQRFAVCVNLWKEAGREMDRNFIYSEEELRDIEDMEVGLFFGDYEIRSLPGSELRVMRKEGGGPGTLIGSPGIPYNSWSEDLGGFVERVLPGAVKYEGYDVVCCRDHEDHLVLGRLSNGTLRLSEGKRGLNYECDLPDVSYARDLVTLIERGDVRGNSFRFTVLRDEWIPAQGSSSARREIHELELYELGPVTMPAYPSTTISLRSLLRSVGVDANALGIAVRKVRSGQATPTDRDVIAGVIRTLRDCLHACGQGTEAEEKDDSPQGRLSLLRRRLELLEI